MWAKHKFINSVNYQFCNKTVLLNKILSVPQLRHQTNAAAQETESVTSVEWQNARPFDEMPTESAFNLFRYFLPGGRYNGLNGKQLMLAYKRDYGDIVKFPAMLGQPAIVVTHNPQDFETVFRNEGIWPVRPGNETMKYHRSKLRADFFQGVEGVLATDGQKWGDFRSAVNPVLMQPKNVRLYLHKMSKVNKQLVERIKHIRSSITEEMPDNFEEELNRWTLESVSIVALDKQLGLINENRDNSAAIELFKNLTDFFTIAGDIEFKPTYWRYFKTPDFKRLMTAYDNIKDITAGYVNEAIERIEQQKQQGVPEKAENEKSMLEKLLKMDKKIATVMAMDLLMAGVDTTSSTFTAILLCLAKNPEKQAKLREEVLRILPEKDSDFDEATLKNIPYTRAVIKESLRMYPLIVGNARIPVNDIVISGYQVPKNTMVSMLSVSLLSNEKHFPKAEQFLPERWLRPSKDTVEQCSHASMKGSNPFVHLPFGFGPRSCVGRRIVEMELELGILRIIRNFHVEFNYPTDDAFKSLLINVPNIPLKFKFTDV